LFCRQNALLATISERDTNIAILEQNPTIQGEQEVRKLKGEKDHLVDQLKQLVRLKDLVDGNYRVEIYIHLLDLTRILQLLFNRVRC
jgi:uncharacterized protein YdcH (DUF465 family)